MILPANASLILSAVQQIVKLGGRLDRLMAQKTAAQADLVLRVPTVRIDNLPAQCALAKQQLAATLGQTPDPFGADRATFTAEAANPTVVFDELFLKYFPDQVAQSTFNPDAAYLAQLQTAFPTVNWNDLSVRIAAFALAAGPSNRQIGYTGRMALAVADTLLEFGAENTALFVRNPKLQAVAQSVLQRFAQPDWDSFDSWNPLLQTALSTSLNSALDVAHSLPPKNAWLDATLDALVEARASSPKPDDFLLGLVQGKGVPLLLSQSLLVAADRLDSASAASFRPVVASVLQAAAPLIQNTGNPALGQFFKDHWGDLIRAGLTSLEKHGPTLLVPDQPILSGVLTAMVGQLAKTPNAHFLSSDTVYRLADAALDTVAANPALLTSLTTAPWLNQFLASAVTTAHQLTARNLFTRAAADALLADALDVLAKNPSLIVNGNPATLRLAEAIFTALAAVPNLTNAGTRKLGETALRAALDSLGQNPQLVSTQFAPVVTAVASQLAGWVGASQITSAQAAALASAAIDAVSRNPQLYASATSGIAQAVLGAVHGTFSNNAAWAPRLLVETANETLLAYARTGNSPGAPTVAANVQQLLTQVLISGLQVAQAELGQSTDLAGIPPILGGLAAKALRGNLTEIDPTSPQFLAAFRSLAPQTA
jgi:hypothetical protein